MNLTRRPSIDSVIDSARVTTMLRRAVCDTHATGPAIDTRPRTNAGETRSATSTAPTGIADAGMSGAGVVDPESGTGTGRGVPAGTSGSSGSGRSGGTGTTGSDLGQVITVVTGGLSADAVSVSFDPVTLAVFVTTSVGSQSPTDSGASV